MYKNYERFKAIIKLFFILDLTVIGSFFLFLIEPSIEHIMVDVSIIAINIATFLFGYTGVKIDFINI